MTDVPPKGSAMAICGPMFAQKTSELIRIYKLLVRTMSVIVFKKAGDIRRPGDETRVSTHDLSSVEATMVSGCDEILQIATGYDAVLVDEMQFFEGCAALVEKLTAQNKVVVFTCLSSDFNRKPFPEIPELLANTEFHVLLKSICAICKGPAAFSGRKQGAPDGNIGASERYYPCCRKCWRPFDSGDFRRPEIRWVSIDGLIGVGKSWIVDILGLNPHVISFKEPASQELIPLPLFYSDPGKFAVSFQLFVLHARLRITLATFREIRKALHEGQSIVILNDRAFPGDWVFVDANEQCGNYPEDAVDEYNTLMDDVMRSIPLPSGYIFLSASVQTCMHRIKNIRGRDCEKGIPEEYMHALARSYGKLCDRITGLGIKWHAMNWNEFGAPEDVMQTINQMPPMPAIDVDVAESALLRILPVVWNKFIARLNEIGVSYDEVKDYHADYMRKSLAKSSGDWLLRDSGCALEKINASG